MRKLFIFIIAISVVFMMSAVAFADNSTRAVIDKSAIDTGIIKVSYNSGSTKLSKVMIEKDGKKYVYSIKHDGTVENFPLQLGNGDYSVSILENVSDNKYSFIHKENVRLNLLDPNKVFLGSVQNINWNENMNAIKESKELTKSYKTEDEKIAAVYQYIVANYRYDYAKLKNLPNDYIPIIDETLAEKKGICYDYSSLFASMLRSTGIPVKLVKGYTDNVNGYHAWNEIYLADTGKWISVDTTYDAQMNEARQKYTMVKKVALYRTVNIY